MIQKKLFFSIAMLAISLSMIWSSNAKAAPNSTRICGDSRYETCSAIVQKGWTGNSDYAVIVSGENFPDALSASVLAKKYNAPILLTENDALNGNAYNELKRLNVKEVFIAGGDFAIKPAVEQSINAMGIQTIRYKGQDRTETSIEVAKQIGTDNGVILTTDSDFTDALSVSPIAGKLQIPIILMPKDTVPESVKNFISDKNIHKTYVLGGTDLISDSVANQFPSIQRIGGNDKYERNINIINAFADKLNFDNVYFAYSETFADALSGSAIAALNGNPIILMGDYPSNVTSNFIKSKLDDIKQVSILGGSSGINDNEINLIINYSNDISLIDELKPIDLDDLGSVDNFSILGKSYRSYWISQGITIDWNLDGKYKTLKFSTGCPDNGSSAGKIIIYGDNNKILETPDHKPLEDIKEYVVDVSNVKVLKISGYGFGTPLINPRVIQSQSSNLQTSTIPSDTNLMDELEPFRKDGTVPELTYVSVLGNINRGYIMRDSQLYWNLNEKYKTLKFSTGCPDNRNPEGLIIYGDGNKIGEIPSPKSGEEIKDYVVDVSNIKILEITSKSSENYATLINPKVE